MEDTETYIRSLDSLCSQIELRAFIASFEVDDDRIGEEVASLHEARNGLQPAPLDEPLVRGHQVAVGSIPVSDVSNLEELLWLN